MQTSSLSLVQKQQVEKIRIARETYLNGLRNGSHIAVSPENMEDKLDEMYQVLNGPQGSIQCHSADVYTQWGPEMLKIWANKTGVFSIPTLELAEWIRSNHCLKSAHEIGCGNGALAAYLNIHKSDSRDSESREILQAVAIATNSKAPKIPTSITKKEGTQAVLQHKPKLVLSQWVTPGGMLLVDDNSGRNGYGPDYLKILDSCETLIFVGNDNVHKSSLAVSLRPADETHRFDWLLSRAKHPEQNFIKVWYNKK